MLLEVTFSKVAAKTSCTWLNCKHANPSELSCRAVWPGIDVFLCIWHVVAAWAKQLRQKFGPGKGARFQLAFDALHAMMKLSALSTPAETRAALQAMASEFATTFQAEPAVVAYFQKHWLPKLGALECLKQKAHRLWIWNLCILRVSTCSAWQ